MLKSLILIAAALPLCVQAQWLNHPDPNAPRTKDGKPDLSAPAPRVNGKPDLSGVWQIESSPRSVLVSLFPPGVGLLPGGENGLGEIDPQKYFLNILADYKPGQEPLTPAAAAMLRERLQHPKKPSTLCPPPSVPITDMTPEPFKIVQTSGSVLMLYEANTSFRQIYTDGRRHPADALPTWMGYSIGRWEGDTFVVDVTGLNDRGPLDAMGHFHSEALHVTERFHRRDFGHLDTQITLEDPKTFTKPVEVTISHSLLPDTDVLESFCTEAEADLVHLTAK
jgi:hypothetical protein